MTPCDLLSENLLSFCLMASDGFTDKNAVFRKLKAKSENKVCAFLDFFAVFYFIYNFLLLFWFLVFCSWDLVQIWRFRDWISNFNFVSCWFSDVL